MAIFSFSPALLVSHVCSAWFTSTWSLKISFPGGSCVLWCADMPKLTSWKHSELANRNLGLLGFYNPAVSENCSVVPSFPQICTLCVISPELISASSESPLYFTMVAELLKSIWDNPDFKYFVPLWDQMSMSQSRHPEVCLIFLPRLWISCGHYVFLTFVLGCIIKMPIFDRFYYTKLVISYEST